MKRLAPLLVLLLVACSLPPVQPNPRTVTPAPTLEPPSLVMPTQDPGELTSSIEGVSGDATFYCNATHLEAPLSRCTKGYPDGPGPDFYAAAGPDLRDGDWRGRIVTVERAGFRPIQVRLIDFCRCDSAVIDLYADAMWALGGTGRIEVTVYGRGVTVRAFPTPPATETEKLP